MAFGKQFQYFMFLEYTCTFGVLEILDNYMVAVHVVFDEYTE